MIPFSNVKSMDVDYSLTTTPTIIEIDLTSKKELIIFNQWSNNDMYIGFYSCDLTDSSIWGKEITWNMAVPSGYTVLFFTLEISKKQLSIRGHYSSHNNLNRIKRLIAF